MFERYTEKARRTIFFARYEAATYGSPVIETEHLLLGILREDRTLTRQLLRSHESVESIRQQIEDRRPAGEKVSTSIDLPLSNVCKRVLAHAAEEADVLEHAHIGPEHLLLGLMRETTCFAAEILRERAVTADAIREQARTAVPPSSGGQTHRSGNGARTSGMSQEAMQALGFAAEEAKLAGSPQIRAGDLLLGLLRVDGSPIADLLRQMGLQADALREQVRKLAEPPE